MNDKHKELTAVSIITGIILAVIFSGANAYLGLRVGMTVSASIPAAVVSMGIIRVILKRNSILENNIVQTIGSAGESVAAGAIFTMPAIFMWMDEWGEAPPSLFEICLISLCGGILGIIFMIPLRRALIVKEDKELPYPEGTACAEVLSAGESTNSGSSVVFKGAGIAAIYKFIADGLNLFPSELHFNSKRLNGLGGGIDILPALTGVGYICGYRIASYMFSGGILAWFVILPLLSFFGGNTVIYPSDTPLSLMNSQELWTSYMRYIGAGAVAAGGIISLIKTAPMIISTFTGVVKGFKNNSGFENDKEKDISPKVSITLLLAIFLIIWLVPAVPVNIFGAVLIVLFGFFFAAVSSRLVGTVGSSNNPVSGMTITTLIITALLLKMTNENSHTAMLGAMAIGSVICIIASVAGDTSQDLKTGFILGATPAKQQKAEIIGVIASSLTIGIVLYILHTAWGYGSSNLPAPQALLMKTVVEGVVGNNLPWTLLVIGGAAAVTAELLGIPVLPFCIGLYLPIHLSAGIMTGGIIRKIFDKYKTKDKINNGILYTSGMIAGEGLVGILLALLAIITVKGQSLADIVDLSSVFNFNYVGGIVAFALLIISMFVV